MNKCILFIVGLAFLASCEEELENSGLCNDEYFYYYGDDKIYLKHSLSEVFIEFEEEQITSESAEAVLKNYPFLEPEYEWWVKDYRLKAIINEECDCAKFKSYLAALNESSEALTATPVFYVEENDPDTYWILVNTVVTRPDTTKISGAELIEDTGMLDLELESITDDRYIFKIKDVKTGFEPLKAANLINEGGKVHYSTPGFYSKFVLF